MDLYKHTYAATNSFHTAFKRDDREESNEEKENSYIYTKHT